MFALRNSDMAETWSIFDLGERVRIFLDKSAQHARYIIFATRTTEIIQQAPLLSSKIRKLYRKKIKNLNADV